MTRITTASLSIEPINLKLAQALTRSRAEAEQVAALRFDDAWPENDMPGVLASYAKALKRVPELLGWGVWIIVREGVVIGDAGFKGMPKAGVVEIGYSIVPRFQLQGFATEAVTALCGWAFEQGVTRVTAQCEKANSASAKVLAKSGMKQTGKKGEMLNFELKAPKKK
jgi:ribosomal-protein-alanine N-acetyltransferase